MTISSYNSKPDIMDAVLAAFSRLDPRYQVRNPVMFLVWVGSVVTTLILTVMLAHRGKVLTHTQLLKAVWGRHTSDQNHYLRIHTQHLREKLKDDPLAPTFIFTEPGIGYRFSDKSA